MLKKLSKDIQNCRVCAEHLPFAPRPVFRISTVAPILLVGQAPGIKVQNSGVPWDDASGDRLREWMDLDKKTFITAVNWPSSPWVCVIREKVRIRRPAPPRMCASVDAAYSQNTEKTQAHSAHRPVCAKIFSR